jgi:hypothetical protein
LGSQIAITASMPTQSRVIDGSGIIRAKVSANYHIIRIGLPAIKESCPEKSFEKS